jgi:hypothetical protein
VREKVAAVPFDGLGALGIESGRSSARQQLSIIDSERVWQTLLLADRVYASSTP